MVLDEADAPAKMIGTDFLRYCEDLVFDDNFPAVRAHFDLHTQLHDAEMLAKVREREGVAVRVLHSLIDERLSNPCQI